VVGGGEPLIIIGDILYGSPIRGEGGEDSTIRVDPKQFGIENAHIRWSINKLFFLGRGGRVLITKYFKTPLYYRTLVLSEFYK